MALLTRIEEIIGIPMELFHQRKGFHPVDLNRMALRCMEQGTRKGIRQIYAPNAFTLRLSLSDYQDLAPFEDTIRADVKGELRRVAEERNYLLAGDVSVTLLADETIPAGMPQITAAMQGKTEPVSTVLLSDLEMSDSPSPDISDRDAPTVVMLPDAERATDDPVAEGIRFLREGRLEAAADRLTAAGPQSGDTPHFLAAMGVAMELLGFASQARQFYRRLQEIEGPRPDVQRRIDYLADNLSRDPERGVPHGEVGRIELGDTGASICFDAGDVQLHNPRNDPRVQVDGSAQKHCRLKAGAIIRFGDVEMTYRSYRTVNTGFHT